MQRVTHQFDDKDMVTRALLILFRGGLIRRTGYSQFEVRNLEGLQWYTSHGRVRRGHAPAAAGSDTAQYVSTRLQ